MTWNLRLVTVNELELKFTSRTIENIMIYNDIKINRCADMLHLYRRVRKMKWISNTQRTKNNLNYDFVFDNMIEQLLLHVFRKTIVKEILYISIIFRLLHMKSVQYSYNSLITNSKRLATLVPFHIVPLLLIHRL